jgi:hypothetical protein
VTGLNAGLHTICVTNNTDTVCGTIFIIQPDPISVVFTTTPGTCPDNVGTVSAEISGGVPVAMLPNAKYSTAWTNTTFPLDTINMPFQPGGNYDTIIFNQPAGTYNLRIQDFTNCIFNETVNLNTICLTPDAPIVCHGDANATVDVSTSLAGIASTFLYSVDGGTYALNTLAKVTGLNAGLHSICVTNITDTVCGTIFITQPDPISVVFTTTPGTCIGNDGTVSAFISGGVPVAMLPNAKYSTAWTNTAFPLDTINMPFQPGGNYDTIIFNQPAGTYNLRIQDFTGCIFNATKNLNSICLTPDAPIVCYGDANGTVDVSTSLAGIPSTFLYKVDNGSYALNTLAKVTGLNAGLHTICVTNITDTVCGTIFITQPDPISVVFTTTPGTCVGNDGTVSAFISGGVPVAMLPNAKYSTAWTNTAFPLDTINMPFQPGGNYDTIIFNQPAGTYNLRIQDFTGCIFNATKNLHTLCLTEETPVSCFGFTDGVIKATTSITGSLLYRVGAITNPWLPNPAGEFPGLAAGTYDICVTNGTDTACGIFILTQPDPIQFGTATATDASCFNVSDGQIIALASGGNSPLIYSILPNTGTQSPSGTFTGLAGSISGVIYTITATDSKACPSSTITATVFAPTPVTFGGVTPNAAAVCYNETVTLTASGLLDGTNTINYTISGPGGPYVGLQTGVAAGGNYSFSTANYPVGAYTVTVHSVSFGGCTLTLGSGNTSTFTVNPMPEASISLNGNLLPPVINATTQLCYSDPLNLVLTGIPNGTGPLTFTYTLNGIPQTPITVNTGGTIYSQTPPLTPGSYAIVMTSITDAKGCAVSAPVLPYYNHTFVVNAMPEASISLNGNVLPPVINATTQLCYSDPLNLELTGIPNGTGPLTFSYSLNGVPQTPITVNTGGTIYSQTPPLTPGSYAIVMTSITDAKGCAVSASVLPYYNHTFVVNAMPEASISLNGNLLPPVINATTQLCYSDPLNLELTGIPNGTGPLTFTYTLNGVPQTPITVNTGGTIYSQTPPLTPGSYAIVMTSITDAKGCAVSASVLPYYNHTFVVHPDPVISYTLNGQTIANVNNGIVDASENVTITVCDD